MHREVSKLPTGDDSKEVTIFRVPLQIRESKKNMFEPSAVSIGPYYRGLPHLKAMEENKWLLLRAFFCRRARKNYKSSVGEEEWEARAILHGRIRKLKKVEQRARCCYSESFDMSSDDFVEMMVLDGCFILAYFTMKESDTVLKGWFSSFIEADFILLENQIPFFIIETLWGSPMDYNLLQAIADVLTYKKIPIKTLSEPQEIHHLLHLCLCSAVRTAVSTQDAASEPNHCRFLQWIRGAPVFKYLICSKNKEQLDVSTQDAASEPNHCRFLQCIRAAPVLKYLICSKNKKQPDVSTQDAASEPNHCRFLQWIRAAPVLEYLICSKYKEQPNNGMVWVIPCATELEEAGVKFKNLEQYDDITKITFQSGTLTIPRIRMTDDIKPLLMNLVALEQCMQKQSPYIGNRFSSYTNFIDNLVNTPHDVKILQNNGILENMLSSEEEVAVYFNQIGEHRVINFEDHYLVDLYKRVNKYCESRYHRYRARLCRDYFNNPWSIIALIAATILMCLTIIQTVMSVHSYIHPR